MCVCHIHSLTCSLAHSSYIYLSLSLSFPFLLHLLHRLLLLFVLLSLSPYSTILFLFLVLLPDIFIILSFSVLTGPPPPPPTHPETSKAVGFRATTMLTNKRKPGVVDRSLLWAQCIHKENTVEFAEIKGKCIVNSTI